MKKTYLSILFCALLLMAGCTKEKADLRVAEFEIPIIHGYHVRDGDGSMVGNYGYGVPNLRLGDGEGYFDSNYFFVCYPNPPIANKVNVLTKSPFNNEPKKLWITHAILRPPFDAGIVTNDDWNNFVAGGAPLFELEFTQKEIRLDVTELSEGYYRVYLKIDNQIFYDNLVVIKNYLGL